MWDDHYNDVIMSEMASHQPHDCLLNRLFRRRSKKISELRVTGLCEGNSPVTGEFPAQSASNAENVSIWWRHHGWWNTLGSWSVWYLYMKWPINKYNAHIEPLFKHLNLLKVNNIFALEILKLYFRFKHGALPQYFLEETPERSYNLRSGYILIESSTSRYGGGNTYDNIFQEL